MRQEWQHRLGDDDANIGRIGTIDECKPSKRGRNGNIFRPKHSATSGITRGLQATISPHPTKRGKNGNSAHPLHHTSTPYHPASAPRWGVRRTPACRHLHPYKSGKNGNTSLHHHDIYAPNPSSEGRLRGGTPPRRDFNRQPLPRPRRPNTTQQFAKAGKIGKSALPPLSPRGEGPGVRNPIAARSAMLPHVKNANPGKIGKKTPCHSVPLR
jgi:hypothetical protein